jgi:hypothetical protein
MASPSRVSPKGNDCRRHGERAQDAERVDLAMGAEVCFKHRGEQHGIDDQG